MAATVCPDRPTIERLLLGEVDHDDAEALDRHLLACERCCAVLDELATQDALADAVRAITAHAPPLDDGMRAVMAHLKEVTLPGKATEETVARSPEHTEDAWELEKLLDSPEGEGELGRFGGYRVLRVLGAGGMGLVFEAEDPKLRRRVALKVMKRSLAARDEHHQRFLREARAAAAIEHPHIVTVHQVGEHRGLPFMAMQLLKGEALDDRLHRENASKKEDGLPSPSSTKGDGLGRPSSVKGALPLAECLRIGRETAEALAEAHSRNLIHRDIKPGNIWLEGASGWVKLVDFGLAHAAEDVHLTQTGAILGTPAYMSPEQARGEAVDGRCDLYSLGAVLYKLTTGDVPFRGATTLAVLMALANDAPRPPGEINPDIPPALNDLIVRLLAKKPEQRFESAQAVADAIRAIEAALVERNSFRSDAVASAGADERNEFRSTNRRWPLVAAAAAACLVFAAIVIVVRDKDGKEVMRATVPDDGSVTVTDAASASKVNPALRDGGAGPSPEGRPTPPPRSVGATLPEPPPLEEWLKGREVLTVAQDGSGQFKTIQAALDALKPHQVVKVLDRGPYRERLAAADLPYDTGMISQQQTTIELPDMPDANGDDSDNKHHLGPADGFRLSGLRFVAPPRKTWGGSIIECWRVSGMEIEDCRFGWTAPPLSETPFPAIAFYTEEAETNNAPIVLRNCVFDSAAVYFPAMAAFLVERNFFRDTIIGVEGPMRNARIRHNVFVRNQKPVLDLKRMGDVAEVVEISNNTVYGGNFSIREGAAKQGVTIRNNITGRGVGFDSEANKRRADVIENWLVDHNSYPRLGSLPKSTSDVTLEPGFLSTQENDRDYLRVPGDSPLATGGAGGDLPSYIGALPPGPAPEKGDWFTRLQERWQAMEPAPVAAGVTDIRPPADVPEPPPLEEWLKGRETLTVAQDGSGQFKTIQGALEALQSGQVVSVLDRGPYHERLAVERMPPDTGLISKQGAIIELSEWKFTGKDERGDWHQGHFLSDIDGFRLHGFDFVFPEDTTLGDRLHVHRIDGLVIEQCRFRDLPNETWDGHPVSLADQDVDGRRHSVWVRECVIEGYLEFHAFGKNEVTAVIERNEFDSIHCDHHIHFHQNAWKQVVVRHNVFHGKADYDVLVNKGWKSSAALQVTNNTSFTVSDLVVFTGSAEHGRVTVRNNVRTSPRLIGVLKGAEQDLVAAQKNWRVDHNIYPAASSAHPWMSENAAPRSAADVPTTPRFLSKNPLDANYLRIADEGPLATAGAGGDWPNYVGALPPGPAPKDGDWFTRLRERWTKVDPALRDGGASPSPEGRPTSPPRSVGATLPEPPPLEEWLKGRTILTVAQDGSGQFRTIQSALDALQSGEVVSVLDRGPYRERLTLGTVPPDTGLISQQETVLELGEWTLYMNDVYQGHSLFGIDGFRLHGFDMHFPDRLQGEMGWSLNLRLIGNLVIEHCRFRTAPRKFHHPEELALDCPPEMVAKNLVWIRHCLIEGFMDFAARGKAETSAVLEQNLFTSGEDLPRVNFHDTAWKTVVFRNNLFTGQSCSDVMLYRAWKSSSVLEVTNNTTTTPVDLVSFLSASGDGTVVVRNNLCTTPRLMAVREGTAPATLPSNWQVDHNVYPEIPPGQSYMLEGLVPRSEADITATPRFISKNSAHSDYLRIAADGPFANAGAGGAWPTYVGALPPGPAPQAGDWFTRIRERWQASELKTSTVDVADVPLPFEISEPPPLEDWLKGRSVLTVAQDGSGQFKTIKAAFDALQPGQVIKVLDAGPYRERLDIEDLPADSGLVSEKGTVLELPEYVPHWKDEHNEFLKGHFFRDTDGFRMAGFTLDFPERPNATSFGLEVNRCGGFVLEQCWLRSPVQGAVEAIVSYHAGGSSKPSCVRECRIDEMLHLGSLDNDQAVTLVTRNVFFGEGGIAHVGEESVYRYLSIRDNVFAGGGQGIRVIGPIELKRFEISNNTLLGGDPIRFYSSLPKGEVIVCNNLRLRPGLLIVDGGAESERDAILNRWRIAHNAYPRELTANEKWKAEQIVPPAAHDLIAIPKFISKVASDRDYVRPMADDPIARAGAGGAWPDYIGALPPGPAPQEGDWFTRLEERW